jgi:predicted Zn-dependent peptidase
MKLDYQETQLPNKVQVLTARMPQVQSVACGIWVGVGGRYEHTRQSGASHFIEHLLFKGTHKRSARAISQAIEGRGGYFNAFTQEEATCYYTRIGAKHAWKALDILADMYLNPRFAPADIDKERGVIIEEIMMYRDQPHQLVQDFLGELIWTNHPVGRPLIGTPENIARMTREEILAFKTSKYTGGNTRVAFAGKVDHDECVRVVEALLQDLSARSAPHCKRVDAKTVQRSVHVHKKVVEQSHVALGFRLFGRHDKRRYVLKLLSVIFGENMSSRLFQVVREKHGLAYSIHSSMHLFDETGALVVSAGLERARTDKALQLIFGEVARLTDRPVAARELRRAKDYAIGQLEIGLENTINQMMWIGENSLSYRRLIQPTEVMQRIEAVTEKDILNLAREIFLPKRTSVAMVTPNEPDPQERQIRAAVDLLR